MNVRPTEYAARGVLGLGTPQANPTVEAELQALRPDGVGLVTARLYCDEADAEARIGAYLDRMGEALCRFDDLQLDAFGFFCTGSTYLRGFKAEADRLTGLEAQFKRPIITATQAIEQRLKAMRVQRLAMVSPYPGWLHRHGLAYWQARGFDVVDATRVSLPDDNVHGIYALDTQSIMQALRSLDLKSAEVILFSGTGMPSLRPILATLEETGLPALSSNLCLAGALFDRIGLDGMALTAPACWAERVASL